MHTINEVDALRLENLGLKKRIVEQEMSSLVHSCFRSAGIPEVEWPFWFIDTNLKQLVKREDTKENAVQE